VPHTGAFLAPSVGIPDLKTPITTLVTHLLASWLWQPLAACPMMFPSPGRRNFRPDGVSVGEFGNKFRKAREKKELSFDDVSNVTKIASRMLQAIEEEHFDQLPGGVFNKGFIRAYAKHLGLNDQEAVTDYLACLRQAQIDAHEVWAPERPRNGTQPRSATPEMRRPGEPKHPSVKPQSGQAEELPGLQLPRAEDVRPQRRSFAENSTREIPWRILAIAAVVIVLAAFLWMRHTRTKTAAASSSNAAAGKNIPVLASTSASANHPPNAALSNRALTSPQPSTSNSHSAPHPPSTSPAAPTPAPATAAGVTANPGAPVNDKDKDSGDVTVRTFQQPTPQPSQPSTATLTLVIRATETSWISVIADGQTVSQETLIAPAHTSVRATREIVAKIGNAAGVTFLFNGQEIPAAGAEAEVKTFVFDANGMRVVPPTPPSAQNN
jgi:cytoskeletal protein RodZ